MNKIEVQNKNEENVSDVWKEKQLTQVLCTGAVIWFLMQIWLFLKNCWLKYFLWWILKFRVFNKHAL